MPAVMFLGFHMLIKLAASYYITVLQCNPKGYFRMFLTASHYLCNIPENCSKVMSREGEDLSAPLSPNGGKLLIVCVSPQKTLILKIHMADKLVLFLLIVHWKTVAIVFFFVITRRLPVLPVHKSDAISDLLWWGWHPAPFPSGDTCSCSAPSVHSYFKHFLC